MYFKRKHRHKNDKKNEKPKSIIQNFCARIVSSLMRDCKVDLVIKGRRGRKRSWI